MQLYKNIKILKINGDNYRAITDKVIREVKYKLFINGEEINKFYCSPDNLRELITGYLYAIDLINSAEDIIAINTGKNCINIEIKNDIGKKNDIRTSNIKSKPGRIFRIAKNLTESSTLFQETGGVHNVLLSTREGEKVVFREDISRNNAVNKVIGNILIKKINPFNKIIALSCRISSIILYKIVKIGIPIVVSVSAPTDKAVEMAIDNDITLIGFVRGKRMNVYNNKNLYLN